VHNPLDVAISLSHHMNRTIDEAIATMGGRMWNSSRGLGTEAKGHLRRQRVEKQPFRSDEIAL
jgi:hypothetical protein